MDNVALGTNRTIRYIIAQYIPDLLRVEPRNIGLIAWLSDGTFFLRFLGDGYNQRVPRFVNDRQTYRDWLAYWHRTIEAAPAKQRTPTNMTLPTLPAIVENLISCASGNYRIAANGRTLYDVEGSVEDAVEDLFQMLIEPEGSDHIDYPVMLKEVCDEMLTRAKLINSEFLRRNEAVKASLSNDTKHLWNFDYVFRNGRPIRLYERCSPRIGFCETKALRFQGVCRANTLPKSEMVALVHYPMEKVPAEICDGLEVLHSEARVINVADTTAAESEFASLAEELERLHG